MPFTWPVSGRIKCAQLYRISKQTPQSPLLASSIKMFGHIYTVLVVLYLSLFAVAGCSSPTKTITVAAPAAPTISQCNTGPIQCCQQTQEANSLIGGILLGLLGIVVEGVDALIGLDCSPINVIGVGSGNACNASPVCCEDNSIGNLISIGCIPITL